MALTALFSWIASAAGALDIGEPAPTLTVTTETGEQLDLREVYAAGPTLIYFYPKADTPGCTKQACNLRDAFAELEAEGMRVLGVSTDGVEAQAAFKAKHNLPFTLIADADKQLGQAFGVDTIALIGAFRRQSFLVVDGLVAWRDLSAAPTSQAQDALAALRKTRPEDTPASPAEPAQPADEAPPATTGA